ncbi:MAG: hypothetical protein Q9182_006361 [Xanthomendoza sp. 2 TL-2023]
MTVSTDSRERSPAFQGARLAFSSPSGSPPVHKSPNNNADPGSHSALAAASSVGRGSAGYKQATSSRKLKASAGQRLDDAAPSYIAANRAARTSTERLLSTMTPPLFTNHSRPSPLRSYSDLSGVANTDGPSINALIRRYEEEDSHLSAAAIQQHTSVEGLLSPTTSRDRPKSYSMHSLAMRPTGSRKSYTPPLSSSSSTASSYASAVDKEQRGTKVALDPRTTLRPPPQPLARPISTFDRRKSSNSSLTTNNPRRIEPLLSDSVIPQLSADSLADAMVASSLASSRAPSPTRPPLPPPRRRSSHHPSHFFHRTYSADEQGASRTPSPSKGLMRHTMRAPLDPNEEFAAVGKHKSGKRFLHKHPNKHHEGDRKRWRDQITEFERKRYEGVWAANRAVPLDATHGHESKNNNNNNTTNNHTSSSRVPPALLPVDAPPTSTTTTTTVLNIIVRDIWSRSNLPPDVLEEIWDLVYVSNGTGSSSSSSGSGLGKAEFVVGMWLIDQRLKGRKLPRRVSDSVWFSARGLTGVKVRRR